MDFDQLKTFLEVSRQKSFSRAAEKLHVTQPSISAQIRSLETHLGHRLLDRGGGKVTLTAAGRVFEPFAEDCLLRLKHASLMLADLEKSFNFAQDLAAQPTRFTALDGRIKFLLKENPEKAILHTVQVERNGFIESILSGTTQEGVDYTYFKDRAYSKFIRAE